MVVFWRKKVLNASSIRHFQAKKLLFGRRAARRGIISEATVRPYHPMARDNNGNPVSRHAVSDRPGSPFCPSFGCQLPIGQRRTEGNLATTLQNTALKGPNGPKIDTNVLKIISIS
jgi:hypothetical protein